MIPYPAYKSTNLPWLPNIPEHWGIVRCKQIFRPIDVRSEKGEEQLLSVSERYGVVKREQANVTMFKAASYEGYKLCWPDDLAINSLWAWSYGLGFSPYHGIISTAYSVFRLKDKTRCLPRFYDYLVRSKDFHWELRVRSKGLWKSRYQLSDDTFLSAPILDVPIAEQEQIVRYLDSMTAKINKLIRAKKKQIALLQEQRQAIINHAVTKGLDPNVEMKDSGIDWLGKIPKHWKIQRLGHFSSLQNGISAPAEYFGSGFPFVGYGDVYNNYEIPSTISGRAKSSNEEQKRYSVQEGDIFFTRTSETMEEIAFSSVSRETIPHATFSGFLIRVRPHKRVISTLFAKYYFRNMNLRNYFVKEMNLVTRASLSQQLLRNLPVILPPIEEQEEIAQKIEAENNCFTLIIHKLEHEITLFDEYKKSLISSVVTGQIDVRNVPVEGVFSDDLIAEDDPSSEIEEEPANESEE